MDYSILMIVLSSLLIGNAVLFAIHFLLESRNATKYKLTHRILGLLLIAFALRITKSVIYILYPEYTDTLTSVGMVGMLAIGPLYWYYLLAISRHHKVKINRFHFLPSLIILGLMPWLEGMTIYWIYLFSLTHLFCYLLLGSQHLYKQGLFKRNFSRQIQSWPIQLSLALTIIWGGFLLQAFIESKPIYIGITFSEVLTFFTLSLIAMKNYKSLMQSANSGAFPSINIEGIAKKAMDILTADKLFLESNLTLSRLAKKVGTTNHALSYALNKDLQKSFPELLNSIRIEHSKSILLDKHHDNLSIEAIAYECGYNSLSAFYSNFKRYNHMTPAQFKKQQTGDKGKS